ncbi:MAG: HAD-IA family hydrolase [Parvibaculaceae bacterium]
MTDPHPHLPTAILFDLDDTLISAYGQPRIAWEKVIAGFAQDISPLTPEDAVEAISAFALEFWSETKEHKKWRLRLTDARRVIVREALERTGKFSATGPDTDLVHKIADRFTALREEEMAPFPGALETIDELKELGVKLALITNGAAETQRPKVDRFGLEHRFDHIQIEGEHGFGKPEEEAYRHALQVLDVSPSETWMVGDNLEWEITAPQNLGIYAIWHDAYGHGLPEGTHVRPDRIIRSIPELLTRP